MREAAARLAGWVVQARIQNIYLGGARRPQDSEDQWIVISDGGFSLKILSSELSNSQRMYVTNYVSPIYI